MAKALTAKTVEHAAAKDARREIPDGLLAGLYLVVQPSGAKSWAVRYRHAGKPRKLTLGTYPALELADAREAARQALLAATKGNDPAGDKREVQRRQSTEAENARDRFAAVAVEFIERYAKRKNRSWAETDRLLKREVLPTWGERRIQEIGRRDVITLLDGIVDRGAGTTANRVLAAIRKLFNWSIERGIITTSPCAGIKAPTPETSRERILTDEELRWLWTAAEAQSFPFGPIAKLLLLTGQRREEVAAMTVPELDLCECRWTLPRSRAKNDAEHHVPLSDAVLAILKAAPRVKSGGGFIWTTNGKTSPSGFSRAKTAIDARMLDIARRDAAERGEDPAEVSIAPWVWHDLRRTAASGMARLGQPIHVVEAVLNHRSGTIRGVARVYNRHNYLDEKRHALDAWARLVAELVSKQTPPIVALGAAW